MKKRNIRSVAVVLMSIVIVSSCSGGDSSPTTTVAPLTTSTSTTTSTTSTTTTTTTTTLPIAPPVAPPIGTVPKKKPVAEKVSGPCAEIKKADYCVWGTYPIDKSATNSTKINIAQSVTQTFTSVTNSVKTVQVEIESPNIGVLVEATEATDPNAVCLQASIVADNGLPMATMAYTAKNEVGVRQKVTSTVDSALIIGAKYSFTLQKGPACATRDLATMAASIANYQYPAKYGSLKVDGQKLSWSLWAVID